MSWQCAHCETVNQDAVPVCTVCDCLAPVVESFLSLEKIECTTEYNEKLDLIHQLEIASEYERMFDVSLEAIALYKDNTLAVKKAKIALKQLQEKKASKKLTSIIDKAIKSGDFTFASCAVEVWEKIGLNKAIALEYKNKISELENAKHAVEDAIEQATNFIFLFQPNEALNIIEAALVKFPADIRLVDIRDKVKTFIQKQNEQASNVTAKSKYPKPTRHKNGSEPVKMPQEGDIINLSSKKRKFPKVKRNK